MGQCVLVQMGYFRLIDLASSLKVIQFSRSFTGSLKLLSVRSARQYTNETQLTSNFLGENCFKTIIHVNHLFMYVFLKLLIYLYLYALRDKCEF